MKSYAFVLFWNTIFIQLVPLLSQRPSPSLEKIIELPRIFKPDAHFSPSMRNVILLKVFYCWTLREEFLRWTEYLLSP
ncbi:MAG: hypothetical protein OJF51_004721 [Nitrospira sp.]|nr:MAG: hypothetical protein OJF51_004721 [Nitrospira sp.]